MSKVRQQVDDPRANDEIDSPATGDQCAFVVFTQLKKGGPYIYAGWLDAPDEQMAMTLAREHYGRDQVCTGLWLAPREYIGGLRENRDAEQQPVALLREYQIFTQQQAGDQHVSAQRVAARSAAEAIEEFKGQRDERATGQKIDERDRARGIPLPSAPPPQPPSASSFHNIWAIPVEELSATEEGELVWRLTDQSYRLARGYSKSVREKWEKIRGAEKTDEYEREDLKETF